VAALPLRRAEEAFRLPSSVSAKVASRLVLLAEDDPDQRELLAEVLEFEGYRVLQAEDAQAVVSHLREQPDALLMDLHGISSPAVTAALETLSPRPALMVLSADRQLPAVAAALKADAYLSKPYELDDLLAKLRGVLTARPSRP
jgi:two-component system, OmpR family, response regulator MprA